MAGNMSEAGYDWQMGKSVIECNLHMLKTAEFSDVTFLLGETLEKVPAHRYVLVSRSCVFTAMFCGPLAEQGEITIPDIDADTFKDFLQFVYSDTVDVKMDNVIGLLYTSRKYALDSLYKTCTSFLEQSLHPDTVCEILEHCTIYGDEDLEGKALSLLTSAGVKVLEYPGFLSLSPEFFKKFIQSEDIKLKEEDVFTTAVEWAKERCRGQSVEPSPANLRTALGDLIYEIRFANMTLDYVVNSVGPTKILTAEERMAIVDRLVNLETEITPFRTGRRRGREPKILKRYASEGELGWNCSGGRYAITFSVNDDIQLLGCQLYGPYEFADAAYSLSIDISRPEEDLERVVTEHRIVLDGDEINEIMFPSPVEVKEYTTYALCVTMKGPVTYYGDQGAITKEMGGVTFTFGDSYYSDYGRTSKSTGQLPGLIWR